MKQKLGENKIHEFRRSWNIKPDPLSRNNPYHPINIDAYKKIPREKIPDTESLKDTYERVIKYYNSDIQNKLSKDKNIVISAHGNSIRALCKFLFKLDNKKISLLEIPTGNPLLINLNSKQEITECKYLDKDRAEDLLIF
jgi:2,3-bisphosphoglycerate-dependent phosphoglycerate mutase